MFEHKTSPLVPRKVFYKRMLFFILLAFAVIVVCLGIGIVGYHYTANIAWLDSFHNASMILSGMGPVVEISTTGGKWFSSLYAIFSGIVFITNIGLILAPVVHRIMHRLHVDDASNN